MSSRSRCAACKSLRRKCPKDCVLAPYFPSSNPLRFSYVHKIFGASNVTKMLGQLPVNVRGEAADCICFEANSRVGDPVYGCVGLISQLQQHIVQLQNEFLKTQGELAYYNAQQKQQILSQNQDPTASFNDREEPFWFDDSNQQEPVNLDQPSFP